MVLTVLTRLQVTVWKVYPFFFCCVFPSERKCHSAVLVTFKGLIDDCNISVFHTSLSSSYVWIDLRVHRGF